MIRFSVIMPCHNAERWVAKALRSAAAQTHPPHQIIVINDNSTDGSEAAIKSSGVDAHYLEGAHGNAAAARNAAIEHATGDFVAFLDSDDEWLPHHLSQHAALLEHGDIGVTGTDRHFYEDGTEHELGLRWPIDAPTPNMPHTRYVELWAQQMWYSNITTAVRLDRFREVGGFDPAQKRRHDIDLWLRVIHGHTWGYTPVPSAHYLLTAGSIGRADWASSEYFALRAMDKNLPLYRGTALEGVTKAAARRATAASLTDGSAEDFDRVWPIAKTHLSKRERLLFRAARLAPGLFRTANKARRQRVMKRA